MTCANLSVSLSINVEFVDKFVPEDYIDMHTNDFFSVFFLLGRSGLRVHTVVQCAVASFKFLCIQIPQRSPMTNPM